VLFLFIKETLIYLKYQYIIMQEYRVEQRCPNCGSTDIRMYPDGTFKCITCGYTNRISHEFF
jgi:ribosomal protein L37AE/L43A